jgi:hypothetical protein
VLNTGNFTGARKVRSIKRLSEQIEFLKNLIGSAQTGNEAAIVLLRKICSSAMEQAPANDLITMAQCLYHVGIEATRAEARRN